MPQRCALASDRNLYITYGYGANGAVMKYNVTNGVWTNCTPQSALTYCGISVCATNPLKLIATTYAQYATPSWGFGDYGDLIFVSNNGGTNWINLFGAGRVTMNANGFPWIVGKAIHWAGALEMDPFNPDRVFVGSGNGIFSTSSMHPGGVMGCMADGSVRFINDNIDCGVVQHFPEIAQRRVRPVLP